MTDTDKSCEINLWNVQGWDLDEGMLHAVMNRVAREAQAAKQINIYPMEYVPEDAPAWKRPGWLEWTIRITYRSGREMVIGAIRRKPGAEYEFCT